MMSIHAIREMSREAAAKAAQEERVPMTLEEEDIELLESGDYYKVIGDIPFIGEYLPEGWTRVDLASLGQDGKKGVYMGDNEGYGALFVDSTGGGSEWEPALTVAQFARFVLEYPNYGYAMVEQGPFQVKIGCYKRVSEGMDVQ